jgi:nitroreductase
MRRAAFRDLAAVRTSVRSYDPGRPVGDAHLAAILVVRDPAVRARLVEESFSGIYQHTRRIAAPVYLALCGVRGAIDLGGRVLGHASYTLTECGIAGEHAVLAAAELGLGTCWIGWFDRRRARRVLGVPAGVDLVALIAVGWPAETQRAARPKKRRKPLEAIAWLDGWGKPFAGGQSERV